MMDYLCSRFGIIVATVLVLSRKDKQTHTDVDERLTRATLVGVRAWVIRPTLSTKRHQHIVL